MQIKNSGAAKFISAGRFSGSANVAMHQHEGIELVLVVQGECVIDTNSERLEGGVDSLFILPPDTLHNQLNKGKVITDYIIFKSSDKFSPVSQRTISVAGDRWISRWITDILDLYKSSDNISVQADNLLAALSWLLDILPPCGIQLCGTGYWIFQFPGIRTMDGMDGMDIRRAARLLSPYCCFKLSDSSSSRQSCSLPSK
ncbi:MAG: AraC family ligand binding domain-containing protein [Lentisphaerota bacterium]